jgi:hypothetical protein
MIAKSRAGRQEEDSQTEILNLAMPFFGLIVLGVVATRLAPGEEG